MTYIPNSVNTSTTNVGGTTTLNGAIGIADTTITLTSVAQFPTGGGTVLLGTEYITYTSIVGNDLTGCARGQFQSTAATHLDTATVDGVFVGGSRSQQSTRYICHHHHDFIMGLLEQKTDHLYCSQDLVMTYNNTVVLDAFWDRITGFLSNYSKGTYSILLNGGKPYMTGEEPYMTGEITSNEVVFPEFIDTNAIRREWTDRVQIILKIDIETRVSSTIRVHFEAFGNK